MTIFELTILIWLGSLAAGFLGSLTGLGGGVVIVPLLTLGFGVDIRYAIGASLVSVIATSSGAAAAYVKEGFSNIRIGMFLEMAATMGALVGAALVTRISTEAIAVIFGIVLIYSAYLSNLHRVDLLNDKPPDPLAARLRMDPSYPTPAGPKAYHVRGVPAGLSLMFLAGTLSGLLGIGSGAVKVLAMDQTMRIPFKVSTTTSNFMIGVIAAASLVLLGGVFYLVRNGAHAPNYRIFHGEPAELRSVWGIVRAAFSFHAPGVIQIGLLLLIATPIARVAFSLFAFALQRDRTYVIVSLVVFAAPIYALTGGYF